MKRQVRWLLCTGYINGAHDMMVYLSFSLGGDRFCPPQEGISIDQARRIIVKWLKNNKPEAMNWSARQAIETRSASGVPM